MNISRKNQLLIVIGIALIFVLYGVAGLIFKFNVDKNIEGNVSLVLMIIAAFIIFAGRRKRNTENESDTTKKENNDTSENKNEKSND